jgi:hypothetical protein
MKAGLVNSSSDHAGSARWRDALPASGSRIKAAIHLLEGLNASTDNATQKFIRSATGMTLVTERSSTIRTRGDNVAHGWDTRATYENTVGRHFPEDEREGLRDMIQFLFSEV